MSEGWGLATGAPQLGRDRTTAGGVNPFYTLLRATSKQLVIITKYHIVLILVPLKNTSSARRRFLLDWRFDLGGTYIGVVCILETIRYWSLIATYLEHSISLKGRQGSAIRTPRDVSHLTRSMVDKTEVSALSWVPAGYPNRHSETNDRFMHNKINDCSEENADEAGAYTHG